MGIPRKPARTPVFGEFLLWVKNKKVLFLEHENMINPGIGQKIRNIHAFFENWKDGI